MGVVRFTLIIDPAGAVSGCEIGQSSGDADLDRATCDLLTERGKFSPATDAQGHATTGRYTSSVRWQIPGSDGIHPPSPQPSALTLSFDVETDGRMTGCRIEHAEGEAAYFKAENLPCNQDKVVSPYLGPDGKPVKRHVVVISQVRVEPVDPAKP